MMARSITIPIVFVVTFCGSSPDFIARAAPTDVKPNVSVNVQNLLRRCASESADDRVEAVETLGKLGEEAAPAIPTLVKLLGDQQAVQRDLPHQPPLVEVSYFASEALRAIGTPALEACIEALGTAEGTQKGRIIITIGKFKNRRALETLLTVLDDPNPDLRCNAIGSSTFLGCKDFVLVARLTKLLASDPDADIRWRSARVLASCGAIEPVIQALKNDKNGTVRADAAEALAKTGNAAVVPVLLQALREDYGEPDWVRRQIIKALGCVPDAKAVDAVLGVLQDPKEDESIRVAAATGLGECHDRRIVQPLESLSKDVRTPIAIRNAAVDCLAVVEGKDSIATLTDILHDNNDNLRFRGRVAFLLLRLLDGRIDDPAVLEAFARKFSLPVYPSTDDPYGDRLNVQREAVAIINTVIKNGKTDAIRKKAHELLGEIENKNSRYWQVREGEHPRGYQFYF
jgi:HEAT repeat protein